MESDYARRGIIDYASDAFRRHLLQHTAAIVNSVREVGADRYTGQRADAEVPGTGCPMRWGDQYFVLTAAHVFDNAEPKDLRVLTYADLPVSFKGPHELTAKDIVDGVPLGYDSTIHRCGWEDLAVVTIDAGRFPGVDFVEPASAWIDPSINENVHCCGFPSDHHVRVNQRKVTPTRNEVDLAIYPTTFSGPVLPFPSVDEVKFYYDGLNEDRHYLIPYDLPGVSNHPRGISGAPVWWESDKRELIWRANLIFAGTCTHSHRNGTRVRIVKASAVRRFLAEVFGDL
jgi:hypothetical protein